VGSFEHSNETSDSKPVVLYGCETWYLILREEHRLGVCENRVLRVFRTEREEMAGRWRQLYNKELHNLYSSSNISRLYHLKELGKKERVLQSM
jgi:hypothetical protein